MAQNRVNVKEIVNEDAASAANKMAGVHITAMTKRLEAFLEQFQSHIAGTGREPTQNV